jgi:signal transduction histidine kinase
LEDLPVPVLRIESPKPNAEPVIQLPEPTELIERVNWFVRLRWRASAAILGVVLLASALDVVTARTTLFALGLAHLAGNVGFNVIAHRVNEATPRPTLQNVLALQIVFDLAILMTLLHFAGGADNPFMMLSVFHMAFAGMLLPLRKALAIGVFTGMAYAAMVLAEASGVLAHHALHIGSLHAASPSLWTSPLFMLGYLSAYGLTGLGVIIFVHDLVHRIREAEALRRQHAQIAQARERLARIGSLVAGVAHTIRNPLHGVLSCIDMLQNRIDRQDGSTAEILELMTEGVNRIENVTSRLLVLARETPPPSAPVDIAALVQDAMQFAEVRARARGVEVRLEIQEVAPLPVDTERLTDAVSNVIDNAIDACAPDDTVTVRIQPTPAPGEGVRIEVADTGKGIAEDEIARIFEPFFTTKPVHEGTGLGLAITRQVVEDHNGDIRVTSQLGTGTTVCIDLPLQATARAA